MRECERKCSRDRGCASVHIVGLTEPMAHLLHSRDFHLEFMLDQSGMQDLHVCWGESLYYLSNLALLDSSLVGDFHLKGAGR